jgi:hypothetical protein
VMGNADVHNPERWTLVTFVDESLQLQT